MGLQRLVAGWLHEQATQRKHTMLNTKSHHNENLNNNRVGKHPGIVFGYETISPIVSGRKQLKSRSVGYAREKRFPTLQHRHT